MMFEYVILGLATIAVCVGVLFVVGMVYGIVMVPVSIMGHRDVTVVGRTFSTSAPINDTDLQRDCRTASGATWGDTFIIAAYPIVKILKVVMLSALFIGVPIISTGYIVSEFILPFL